MEHSAVGIGATFLAIVVAGFLILLVYDLTQKRHAVLRNYPVIGHMRYILEDMGVYLRQYFYAGDREEMPFECAARAWISRSACRGTSAPYHRGTGARFRLAWNMHGGAK